MLFPCRDNQQWWQGESQLEKVAGSERENNSDTGREGDRVNIGPRYHWSIQC